MFLGILTGLVPGLHQNTVALVLFALSPLDSLETSCLIFSMSVSHNLFDFIPALLFSVPDPELSILQNPTILLIREHGFKGVVNCINFGYFLGFLFSCIICILLLFLPVRELYLLIRPYLPHILILISLFFILHEKNRLMALIVFLLAGFYGMASFDMVHLIKKYSTLEYSDSLFPVFTGLFGITSLIMSEKSLDFKEKSPEIDWKDLIKFSLIGSFVALIIGLLPSLSPAQGVAMTHYLLGRTGIGFVVSSSAVNSGDTIFSVVSCYTIKNPRSGVGVLIEDLIRVGSLEVLLMISIGLISLGFSSLVFNFLIKNIKTFDIERIKGLVLLCLFILLFIFSGPFGILISLVGISIGLLPHFYGISRIHCMGVLIMPTIIFLM